jgi:hypothetical protein
MKTGSSKKRIVEYFVQSGNPTVFPHISAFIESDKAGETTGTN